MKIALLGYGKMGRLIEQLAEQRGHEVVLRIEEHNAHELSADALRETDLAIDFSTPDSVLGHIQTAFEADIPLVVGTTGWYQHLDDVKADCQAGNKSLLYASNFSIGVNVFFHINRLLARIMNRYPDYEVLVEEIHHTQKLDAPSGTAITIAEGIIDELDAKSEWVNYIAEHEEEKIPTPQQLLIESHRVEEVPGTHTVLYSSEVDEISFRHQAHNRAGFALGAILAAEWLQGRRGFYSVQDLFDFSK